MTKFEFHPWDDAPKEIPTVPMEVLEPPCKHCKYWRPRSLYSSTGILTGVRLCWGDDGMYTDFSCYVWRED